MADRIGGAITSGFGGLTKAIKSDYRDYPEGSAQRAQLLAADVAANRAQAQAEVGRAQQRREGIRKQAEAERAQREARAREVQPGFRTRIADFVTKGVLKTVQAPFGLVYDLARAPFNGDEDFDLSDTLSERGGQVIGGLIGPRGAIGSAIGLLPPAVREFGTTLLKTQEDLRREALIEPITKAIRGEAPYSLSGDLSAFDDPNAPNTIGRGLIAPTGLNSEEGAGRIISGGLDVVSAIFIDPLAVLGVGGVAARRGIKGVKGTAEIVETGGLRKILPGVEDVSAARQLAKAVDSKTATTFIERIGDMPEQQIYDSFFSNHPNGPALAAALKEGGDTEGRKLVLKAMLGDIDAKVALEAKGNEAAVILDNLQTSLDAVPAALPQSFPGPALVKEGIDPVVEAASRADQQARRAIAVWDELDRIPTETLLGKVRTGQSALAQKFGSRSDFYQSSAWARPIHGVFDRLPKANVDLNRPSSAQDFQRMLNTARMPVGRRDGWMARYARAQTASDRYVVFQQAEEASMRHLAESRGISPDEIDEMVAIVNRGRSQLTRSVSERVYAGHGRDLITLDDGLGPIEQIHYPVFATQTPNYFHLGDFDRVRRTVTRWGQFKARHPSVTVPLNVMSEFQDIWRPAQIMKVSTSLVIQTDQQARIYAKLGALTQVKTISRRAFNYTRDTIDGVPAVERGLRTRRFKGVSYQDPFGATGDDARLLRNINSGRSSMDELRRAEITEGQKGPQLAKGGFREVAPTEEAVHLPAMSHALNHQLGKDPLARQILEGRSRDEILGWMRGPEGRAYRSELPLRSNLENWVDTATDVVHSVTTGSDELAQLALEGKVTPDDIKRIIPDTAARPNVNGMVVDQIGATSELARFAQTTVDRFFKWIFAQPDDVLSRNPLYDALYTSEMERMIGLALDQGAKVTDTMTAGFAKKARELALREAKTTLYDLADQSRAAEILRFAVPFFEPVREGITIWSELAMQHPQRVARIYALLRAPIRAGFVRDERGNVINENGEHIDPNTGEVVTGDLAGKRQLIALPLPSWVREAPWIGKALGATGNLTLDLRSIKIGFPREMGFGPIIQIPLNQLVRSKPSLEEAVEFLLPFGTTDIPIAKQLLPASVRNLLIGAEGDDNRAYAGAQTATMLKKLTDFRLEEGRVPTEEELSVMRQEAIDETRSFWSLKMAVSYLTPFAIGYESPYKPYADAYRAAQSLYSKDKMALADPLGEERSPDEWFVQTHGEEYFAVTRSVTKSLNGVPATVAGAEEAERLTDLVQAYPELGGLIAGSDGTGEFNRTVWLNQLNTPLKTGSSQNMRKVLDLVEASKEPQVDLGWQEFSAGMDIIDAARKERGLTSLSGAAAADLAEAKRTFIAELSAKYPAWADIYGDTDANKWKHKIEGLEKIAADPRLANRREIEMLGQYLEGRRVIQQQLAARDDAGGAKTLSAQSNADLAQAWDEFNAEMVDGNLAWADVYHRYLELDPVVQ
ncbi:MAG: hypothetical protein WAT66_14575 [Actinomycetota bacterium]